MIESLYLDLDGVLADFDKALLLRGVVNNDNTFHHKPAYTWTAAQTELDRAVRRCMEAPDFWNNIPLMPGAHELWDYAKQFPLYILTATPNLTDYRERIEIQKRGWVQAMFGPFPDDQVHVCLRSEKRHHAREGAVLVDDMAVNCSEWRRHGGTAIQHTSAAETIKQLRSLAHDQ